MTLRNAIIKLATDHPELRKQLLPLVRKTAMQSRYYNIASSDAATIASEVVGDNESTGWAARNEREQRIAKVIEAILAEFNIGYTDDMLGEWSRRKGGTKFFQ